MLKVRADLFGFVPLDRARVRLALTQAKFREYVEGTETIAIALVINGQEIWIGNDDIETDENAKYQGVLKTLEAAIDKMGLPNAGPPGSKGLVISYSVGAEVKVAATVITIFLFEAFPVCLF